MTIKIHHLNCGTMCPFCQRLMNSRQGSWFEAGRLVCHCLLIETPETLMLVDTGMGLQDIADPQARLGRMQPPLFKPRLIPEETAFHQVQALGYDPRDVRHIIPTHLDVDHAGGMSDFPDAQVHVLPAELGQLTHPDWRDKGRFRPAQFSHHPQWTVHDPVGESWFGFEGVRPIEGLSTDVLIIPLIGHTKGHVGVAVRDGERWLLHCGDAYYHHSQVTAQPDVPAGLQFFQSMIAAVPRERVRNLARLQTLAMDHADEVELFCAHDPVELERYTVSSTPSSIG
jgi:glyoxylase-like metal-dependent hydrolase (beta-lactamase superfamily II)